MSKSSKKTDSTAANIPGFNPGQTYRFDPMYGFVPVAENNENDTEQNTETSKTKTAQNPYPGYGPYYGAFADVPPMPYPPYHYGMHRFGRYPYCPPYMVQQQAMYGPQSFYANAGYNTENDHQTSREQQNETTRQALTQEKIQEIYSAVNDAINGNPDPNKLLGILQNTNGDFWKGLAIGAGAVLLFNSTPLKAMLAGLFASAANAEENTENCGCDEQTEESTDNEE